MVTRKEEVYRISFDVAQSLQNLRALETQLSKLEQMGKRASSGKVTRAVLEEKTARDKLNAAVAKYRKSVKASEKESVKASKAIEQAIKRDEIASRKAAKAAEKAAKAAIRSREQFKKAFLSIGKGSSSGFGAMVRNAAGATIALVGVHRMLMKIGEAKDRYLRFDELTTATMTIAHAGEKAFEHGSRGAEKYRDAIREAADEVKVAAAEMSNSALFWAKAGQTNADTIVELSKVGTLFARANRDAENNVLNQARANDILSDQLQMFRKDTSTTEKAIEEATKLGDKMTAAANSGNIVVEQLFDYSKKVAGLFKTGDVADDEIMAIATSLAAAGLKEESGVHVRRILTQLAKGSVQKLLAESGIAVADKQGNIRSFGDIFGELQNVLKGFKPLERMDYLRELFGQRAVSTAAAMAGLNESGDESISSISTILGKIKEAEGIAKRNNEQYLKTTAGRVQAITSVWSNALDKVLNSSGIIQKILTGLENIDPVEVFQWMENVVIPALESFGITMRDTVIPGIQMAGESLSSWFSPALSVVSELLGGATSSAEGFANTITTLVKLWVKWRIAMLAFRGLRMIDWFADMAKKAMAASVATKALGTTTVASVGAAKTAVGGLAGAFTAAGVGIAAAIAAWGLYDLIVGPIIDAGKRIEDFKIKHGKDFRHLKPGDETVETIRGKLRDSERILSSVRSSNRSAAGMSRGAAPTQNTSAETDLMADIANLKQKLKIEIEHKYEINKDRSVFLPGQSRDRSWTGESQSLPTSALEARFEASKRTGSDLEFKNAKNALIDGLREQAEGQQELVHQQNREMIELAHEQNTASTERADIIIKSMDALGGRLKSNEEQLRETAGRIGDLVKVSSEKNIADTVEKVQSRRKAIRKGSFQGGKSKPLNPFVIPLLSGLDDEGNRMINLAMQKGNAAEYFRNSPQAREQLSQGARSNPNIQSVHFGDTSISITAKSDANPKQIATVLKKEADKVWRKNQEDFIRVMGSIAPAEI